MIYHYNKSMKPNNINWLIILLLIFSIFITSYSIINKEKAVNKHEETINTLKIKKPITIRCINVTATTYNPVKSQCDDTPLITADNSRINIDSINIKRWIAISRDLEEYYKLGDTIYVDFPGSYFNGKWIIKDRMNKRWNKRIDFLIHPDSSGFLVRNLKIYKYNEEIY